MLRTVIESWQGWRDRGEKIKIKTGISCYRDLCSCHAEIKEAEK
jgi:hypothetical protein